MQTKSLIFCKIKGVGFTPKTEINLLFNSPITPNLYKKDAREDLEAEYRIYHALGKNGVMDGRRAKFLNLSYEPVEDA